MTTIQHFDIIKKTCTELFTKKTQDYGTSWRILRPSSLTDLIYIKANRAKSLESLETQLVQDPIEEEYIAIINYSIMALIQMKDIQDMDINYIIESYKEIFNETIDLMSRKNHDYGEAWREMRISSIIDIILMKILRSKSIEDKDNTLLVSEGKSGSYQDMINYSIFSLIKLGYQGDS